MDLERQIPGEALAWSHQTPMSDLGRFAGLVADLPSSVDALNSIVQGILVHSGWLKEYGLDPSAPASRATLSVSERLAQILSIDPRPLQIGRPAESRAVGTCRDFSLILCSFLRAKGVPARLRCGFASYFGRPWEDHWVCEYWDARWCEWRLSDAQIDSALKSVCRIEFNSSDVPRASFATAGEAWRSCRRGTSDAAGYGHHGEAAGLWFVKVNVMRDHLVLNGRETSGWDRWREATIPARIVSQAELALFDDLAERPAQPLKSIEPDWVS